MKSNTIALNGGRQLVIDYSSSSATVRNNILWADGSGRYSLYLYSSSYTPTSDYNLLYATNGASVSNFGSTLAEWRSNTGQDEHSISVDPLFVNATGGDFHLQSSTGSYHDGAWTADTASSPAIDTGYGDVGDELSPNSTALHGANEGQRNLGAYGGTEQGSKTPTERLLVLLEPLGAEVYDTSPEDIRWTWVGQAWQSGDTLNLEDREHSSLSGGGSWSTITGAGAVAVEAGAFSWDASVYVSSPMYKVRATSNQDSLVSDESSDYFQVRVNGPITYYVNDATTTNDLWCTAVGDDTNDGLTPGSPKATIQDVIDTYDLEPGDVVRIDTGTYTLTANITVGSGDQGDSTAAVTFEASPYGVTIDRDSTNSSTCGWSLYQADYVTVRTAESSVYPAVAQSWMDITGGYYGIQVSYSDHVTVDRLELSSNTQYGLYGSDSYYLGLTNSLIHDNGDDGVHLYYGYYANVESNTIAFNGDDQLYVDSCASSTVQNNILWANGTGDYVLYTNRYTPTSDYNLLYASNGASVSNSGTTLAEWRSNTGQDEHSISVDPLFVNAAGGDFHLQSSTGSYHDGAWTADTASSLGIDTGYGDVGDELSPNSTALHGANVGQRNLGAYGGTEQGSKTPAERLLVLLEPIGVEVYDTSPQDIRWAWVGQAWQSGDTLKLEDSADSGTTWNVVSGAGAVPVEGGAFSWDIIAYASSSLYRVEATCNQDISATDSSADDFQIRILNSITYYVNDATTTNDLWCTAVGDDGNDGLTPATPKATIQDVIDTYDLEPGDVVRIDTGTYMLTANITVGSGDQGDSTAPVTFEAAPYGVTIDRDSTSSSSYGWYVDNADYVTIETAESSVYPALAQSWMNVTGGYYGINVSSSGHVIVDRVEVASNTQMGVYGSESNYLELTNSLIHDNGYYGVSLYNCDYATLKSNTIALNAGRQLYIGSSSSAATVQNNILWADGSGRYSLYLYSSSYTLTSDYNLLYATNGASVSNHGSALAEWRSAKGQDEHSISVDPLFVDASGGDFHLQSTTGSYHGGNWTADTASSPAIDTGYGDVGDELSPNSTALHGASEGERNLGAYGGTEQGSKTPTERLLVLLEPIGAEVYETSPQDIRWTWVGQAWQSGDTLNLEDREHSSLSGGGSWSAITGVLGVETGSFSWDVSAYVSSPMYKVRATSNQDSLVSDVSSDYFQIRVNGPITYYVNDATTTNDLWCTAVGDDGNDGLTPATPKATIQDVIDTYDLEPGDVVRIDTGTYSLTANITVGSGDQGDSTAPVTFEASPYGVTINRGDTSSGSYGWRVENAGYVTVRTAESGVYPTVAQSWMNVTGGYYGINLSSSAHVIVDRVEVASNTQMGVYGSESNYLELTNSLIHANGYYGVYLYNCDYATVKSNTIALNGGRQLNIDYSSSSATVRNNILWADGSGRYSLYLYSSSYTPTSDYNLLYATNGASVSNYGSTLAEWRSNTGQDEHSISVDPLFVDTSGGDFHLQSTTASYHGGSWTADTASSPAIDTGYGDVGDELSPNSTALHGANEGQRNLGAYGGTEQGSKTPMERLLVLLEPLGAEVYDTSPQDIRWTWVGQAWQSSDTLNLEESDDSGTTWNAIAGAGAVSVEGGAFSWDISAYASSSLYRVEATCNQDTSATDSSADDFQIRILNAITYYVNDSSTANDLWCTAVGNDGNDGLTPATPKATIQDVIDTYDLEPGDVVRIDTGTYILTANITVGSGDQGDSTAPVTFEASPYGVTINRGDTSSGSYGWRVDNADYVTVRTAESSVYPAVAQSWMNVTGGYYGINLSSSAHVIVDRVEVASNTQMGVYGSESNYLELTNSLIHNNGYYGVSLYNCDYATVKSNTIALNGGRQLYIGSSSSSATVRNNILWADGSGRYSLYLYSSSYTPTSDYNLLYATNGASVSNYGSTLAEWRSNTGQDEHSISVDPLFVDTSGGDFHLQSTTASYHGGSWTADTASSLAIDTGYGDVGDELSPNSTALHGANEGQRNLGAYGGTEQGSKTPMERLLVLLEPLGAEVYDSSPEDIRWTWVGQAWQSGDTLNLEDREHSSLSGGGSWSTIAGAAAVEAGAFSWDVSVYVSSPMYKVRATSNQDSLVNDESSDYFQIRVNGPITYYVNDASTTNDLWCTAVGDDGNDGLTPATPKATIQDVIDSYDLEPGDVVRIDTGTYSLTANITVGSGDQGDSTAPVTFEASPYGVTINRGDTSSGSYGWRVDNADYVTVRTAESSVYPAVAQSWMNVTGGYYGINVSSSGHVVVDRVEVASNTQMGVYGSESNYLELTNSLIHNNGYYGVSLYNCDYATVKGNTIALNAGRQLYIGSSSSSATVRNNILWADGSGRYSLYLYSSSYTPTSDYNLLYATNGASVSNYGSTLAEWRSAKGQDEHSISVDPLFVDVSGGDFHLQSTTGSYHGGSWTADTASSPAIDTGYGDVGDELSPNSTALHGANEGQRNLGAYGGTEQGSKTPMERLLVLLEPLGAEVYDTSPQDIRWTWVGQAWQSSDTLNLEESDDSGTTWNAIAGAGAVSVEGGAFSWDISAYASSSLYRVEATCNQDTSATDSSADDFQIRILNAITYYVNDSSTANDLWCTAVGNDGNDGLTPATPKATIQDVIDTYDLEPGDVVRIDTGTYILTANITVGSGDQGDSTAPVTFEASPYGVTINRGDTSSGSYGWRVDNADYVTVRTAESSVYPAVAQSWMNVTGGYYGINLSSSAHVIVDRVEVASNTQMGVYGSESNYLELTNSLIHNNGYYGVSLYNCDYATVKSNTIALNGGRQLYIGSSSSSATVRNNILWADGTGSYALYLYSSSYTPTSDYNLLYATNDASVSNSGSTLAEWQVASGQDEHSISADPLFVDASGGDFHLQSMTGSYHGGAWTADAATSPAIDSGDPSSDFAEEPLPNGGIINLGAYGNTEQASESPLDFADAPSPYPTLLASDGARHVATGPTLGSARDSEADGQPTAMANGDDTNGTADEDGVVGASSFAPGMTDAWVEVVVSADSYVNAWIDFNGDGTWDSSEQLATDLALTAGTNHVTFAIPATAVPGITYARLRLTSYDTGGTLLPTGLAEDGEVEDYIVQIDDELYLYGTEGDDAVVVTTDGSNYTVTINGVSDVYSMATYSSIVINGDGGTDSLEVYDWTGDDTFAVDPTEATMDWGSDGVDVTGLGFETVKGVAANGGTDVATLTGTTGADKFYGKATQAYVYDAAGSDYRYTASGFDTVTGVSGGGDDTAYLYGSTGDDTLDVTVGSATMTRAGSTTTAATGFAYVNGYGVAGGTDTATMTGTTATDVFTGKETYAYMRNDGGADYLLYVTSFSEVTAYGDGSDTAYLYGGASNDTLQMSVSSSTLTRSGSTTSVASDFGTVNGYAGAGGSDTATMTGSTGTDLFSGKDTGAYMRNVGGTTDYFLYAAGFAEVTGDGNGGADLAYLYGSSSDDTLELNATSSTMTRAGVDGRRWPTILPPPTATPARAARTRPP